MMRAGVILILASIVLVLMRSFGSAHTNLPSPSVSMLAKLKPISSESGTAERRPDIWSPFLVVLSPNDCASFASEMNRIPTSQREAIQKHFTGVIGTRHEAAVRHIVESTDLRMPLYHDDMAYITKTYNFPKTPFVVYDVNGRTRVISLSEQQGWKTFLIDLERLTTEPVTRTQPET